MCLGSFIGQIREEHQNSETPWNVWKLMVFPLQSPLTWASVWCENLKWLLWSRQKTSWKNPPVLCFFFLIFGHACDIWNLGATGFPDQGSNLHSGAMEGKVLTTGLLEKSPNPLFLTYAMEKEIIKATKRVGEIHPSIFLSFQKFTHPQFQAALRQWH